MGYFETLQLSWGMNKEEIKKQLFVMRKQYMNRTNAADAQKGREAELVCDVISDLQNLVDKCEDNVTKLNLLLESCTYMHDIGQFNDAFRECVLKGVNGDGVEALNIANFISSWNNNELSSKWLNIALNAGIPQAYEAYGIQCAKNQNYTEAVKYLEKYTSEVTQNISGECLFYLSLSYCELGQGNKAISILELLTNDNSYSASALHNLGILYWKGNGVAVDLQKAANYMERAAALGLDSAASKLKEIRAEINQQQLRNMNAQTNQQVKPVLKKGITPTPEPQPRPKSQPEEKKKQQKPVKPKKERKKHGCFFYYIVGSFTFYFISIAISTVITLTKPSSVKTYADTPVLGFIAQMIHSRNGEIVANDTDASPISDFEVKKTDGGVYIVKYLGNDRDVIVPSVIDYETVVGIGNDAFEDNVNITSVVLKDGIKWIGVDAFRNCQNLGSVEIPETVETIDNGCFAFDIRLSEVKIADGETMATIGHNAFEGCKSLQKLEIPSRFTSIGERAFKDCISLLTVTMYEGMNELGYAAFENCAKLNVIDIPASVSNIPDACFINCTALTEVYMQGGGVHGATIGNEAFRDCTSLRAIYIPDNYVRIGEHAFRSCTQLTEVSLGSGMEHIGRCAFEDCSSIGDIYLPATINYLDEYCFKNNISLGSIIAEKGDLDVTIGYQAFYGCASLVNVELPGNYAYIHNDAFAHCTSLTSFRWEASDMVFANQTLGNGTFYNCTSLTEVHLPNTVGQIESGTFSDCWNVVVYAPAGSDAERLCNEYGIPFVAE